MNVLAESIQPFSPESPASAFMKAADFTQLFQITIDSSFRQIYHSTHLVSLRSEWRFDGGRGMVADAV